MQYKDFIAENRINELVNRDWLERLDSSGINNNVKNGISNMIQLLKKLWDNYDNDQKMYIGKSLKHLLNYCIKYHKAKADNSN